MAKQGLLEYTDAYGETTLVNWVSPDETSTGLREYCGASSNPVKVKWSGTRYGVAVPSSATVSLLINNDDDRNFLHDIFEGGYTVSIIKNGQTFWQGQVTPSLGIEQYKHYPYALRLNCNDGQAEARNYQFLMTDWPEPWPNKASVLELLCKYIDIQLYPRGSFYINVAVRVYSTTPDDALEDTYIDPRVFMNDDNDEYVDFERVVNSLLGPLDARLVQWGGEWWVLANDQQYKEGDVPYTKYTYIDGVITRDGYYTDALGIQGLYDCIKVTAIDTAQVDYLEAWKQANIEQDFQVNNNILQNANRTGSNYYGHDGTALEFNQDAISLPPVNQNLRHWDGDAPTSPKPGESIDSFAVYKWNAGAFWLAAVQEPEPTYDFGPPYTNPNILKTIDITDGLEFGRVNFQMRNFSTYKGVVGAQGQKYKYKKWVEIQYHDGQGNIYYLWNRWSEDADDRYIEWVQNKRRCLRIEDSQTSIDYQMPGNAATGGQFVIYLWQPADEHGYDPAQNYGVLYYGVQLGVNSVQYMDSFIWEDPNDRQTKMKRWITSVAFITGNAGYQAATLHGVHMGTATVDEAQKRQYLGADAPRIEENEKATSFEWNDVIRADINPKSIYEGNYSFRWGLDVPGVQSEHELHLSSAYDVNGKHIQNFYKHGVAGPRPLLSWKAAALIQQNFAPTVRLTGKYRSQVISPLQLVEDMDDRVFRFISGTWNDKLCQWDAEFIEFKEAIQPPAIGDFDTVNYNNDFYVTT